MVLLCIGVAMVIVHVLSWGLKLAFIVLDMSSSFFLYNFNVITGGSSNLYHPWKS